MSGDRARSSATSAVVRFVAPVLDPSMATRTCSACEQPAPVLRRRSRTLDVVMTVVVFVISVSAAVGAMQLVPSIWVGLLVWIVTSVLVMPGLALLGSVKR